MQSQYKLLTAALAALLLLAHSDVVQARSKKTGSSGDLGIQRDASGTPIIMKGFRTNRADTRRAGTSRSVKPATVKPADVRQAYRPARIPRGSGTAIPSQVGTTTGQTVQPYNPPRIETFSDRVTNSIHSYPLQKGIGNNPADQQMYIRQKAN
jgi:hypothetical protein